MIPIPSQYRILAACLLAAALIAIGFGAGYKLRDTSADRDEAVLKASHSQAIADAEKDAKNKLAQALASERAIREDTERTANAERERAAAALAAATGLASERDRLRNDLRRYSAARACTASAATAIASGGFTGPAAGVVSADVRDDMLDEAAEALRVLAPAVDTARAKHAACAAIWNQARERLKRIGEGGRTLEIKP